MPGKVVKMEGSGTWVTVKAIRLASGALLVPARMAHDRTLADWLEVPPGSALHKRWSSVAVDEPDPRLDPAYRAWKARIVGSDAYQAWRATLVTDPRGPRA